MRPKIIPMTNPAITPSLCASLYVSLISWSWSFIIWVIWFLPDTMHSRNPLPIELILKTANCVLLGCSEQRVTQTAPRYDLILIHPSPFYVYVYG